MATDETLTAFADAASARERRRLLRDHPELRSVEAVEALKKEVEARLRRSPEDAARAVRAAEHLARELGTPAARGRAVLARAFLLHGTGRFREARPLYARARAALLRSDDRTAADRVLLPLVDLEAQVSGHRAASRAATRARRAFLARGDERFAAMVDMNLANALHRAGRLPESLARYDRAGAWLSAANARAGQALNDVNRANVLALLGRSEEALGLYARGAAWFRERGQEDAALRCDYNAATARFLAGEFQAALTDLALVEERFAARRDHRHLALVRLDRAEILLRLGQPAAADGEARAAGRAFRRLGLHGEAALAAAFSAIAAAETGDGVRARSALQGAQAALSGAGWRAWAACLALHEAGLALRSGDAPGARTALARAHPALRRAGLPDRLALAEHLAARAAEAEGLWSAARRAARRALAILSRTPLPWIRWRVHHGLGRLADRGGDRRLAARHYSAAVRDLEVVRDALAGDEVRGGLLEEAAALYEDYVLHLLSGRAPDRRRRAFDLLERARARSLLAGLEGLPPPARLAGNARAGAILAELRALEARVAAALHGARDPDDRRGGPAVPWAPELRRAERRARALLVRLEAVAGPGARPDRPEVADLERAQSVLREDERFVGYSVLDGRLQAFVLRRDGLAGPVDLAAIEDVTSAVRALRRDLVAAPAHPAFRDAAARAAGGRLAKLGEILLRPLRPHLGDGPLRIAPAGALHDVPFHALRMDGRWIGDSREVSVTPSLGAFWLAREHGGRGTGPALVLGLPDERAPRVEEECAAVGAALPGASVACGSGANLARLTDGARGGARVVHLATHGLFAPDAPHFSAFRLADGWVGLREVYGLPLAADLVFLSACDGALGGRLRTGESLGLARALLLAGAASLVAAAGPVADDAATTFTSSFYRALAAGGTVGDAHRAATAGARERDPHPARWALFTLHGDPTRSLRGALP